MGRLLSKQKLKVETDRERTLSLDASCAVRSSFEEVGQSHRSWLREHPEQTGCCSSHFLRLRRQLRHPLVEREYLARCCFGNGAPFVIDRETAESSIATQDHRTDKV